MARASHEGDALTRLPAKEAKMVESVTEAADLLADGGRAVQLAGPLAPLIGSMVGVTERSVRNWMSGKHDIDPEVLERMRRVLLIWQEGLDHSVRALDGAGLAPARDLLKARSTEIGRVVRRIDGYLARAA